MNRAAIAALALLAAAGCEKSDAPRGGKAKAAAPTPAHPTVAEAHTIPSTLQARVQSKTGPNWSVELAGSGSISWRFAPDKASTVKLETAMVPVARWRALRRALDDSGAFELQPSYRGDAKDGDDWSFSVDFGDRAITSRGKDGGKPEGEVLEKIFAAMNALTGNRLR